MIDLAAAQLEHWHAELEQRETEMASELEACMERADMLQSQLDQLWDMKESAATAARVLQDHRETA